MIVLKWIGGVLAVALFLFVGIPALLIGLLVAKHQTHDNLVYARHVFSDVPHDSVLASRRWHPLQGRGGWDCTFAVVRLPEDAPYIPPKVEAKRRQDWHLVWGPGDWVATPDWAPCDNCRDAVAMCSAGFDEDTAARLLRALTAPGSWAQNDGVGETVSVYSAPERIAARIRFGD